MGIFSSNEEADDIATADLKYLLLPYMQGYILSETHERDTHKRLASLEEAVRDIGRCVQGQGWHAWLLHNLYKLFAGGLKRRLL